MVVVVAGWGMRMIEWKNLLLSLHGKYIIALDFFSLFSLIMSSFLSEYPAAALKVHCQSVS